MDKSQLNLARYKLLSTGMSICLCLFFSSTSWGFTDLKVHSYYGGYQVNKKQAGKPAPSLGKARLESWQSPNRMRKTKKIGVLFPHLKDSYFIAVNYGIATQAKALNLSFNLYEAGGYNNIVRQRAQFKQLIEDKVDGIILASISYTQVDDLVKEATEKGIVVVEVINDIYSEDIHAKALVSFYDMGQRAGEFVAQHSQATKDKNKGITHRKKIAFFPGPAGSGWAPETLKGFFSIHRKHPGKFKILPPKWGDTGYLAQKELIKQVLAKHKDLRYIIANAVAAEVAVDLLAEQGLTDKIDIISTYISPTIYGKIKKNKILAAPSDFTVSQGKMAVDMMVKLLNGEKAGVHFPFRSGPLIPVITAQNMLNYPYEMLFGKKDYQALFNYSAPLNIMPKLAEAPQ